MPSQFEMTGNNDQWPLNVPGKPTQAAVFGVVHPTKGKCCEILWSGKFPDLDGAMYWAAKKEMAAVRKGEWIIASRVLWQHELTAEQAVAVSFQQMSAQIDQAMRAYESGEELDPGEGPMHVVKPEEVENLYVEIMSQDDPHGDPIASFIAPVNPPGDENDVEIDWTPRPPPEPSDN